MEDSDELTPAESADQDTVLDRVITIVADVLERPRSDFALETAAADIEGWDSFGHVRIVLAIDKAFGIHMSMGAIEKADGIASLVEVVEEAQSSR